MSDKDAFDAILASLHKAMLDDAHWPATFHLIDDLCGMTGNGLGPVDIHNRDTVA